MKKYMMIAAVSSLLLAGCGTTASNTKPKKEEQVAKHVEQEKEKAFEPKATVVTNPITSESTNTMISTKDIKESVTEIQYHVWRTADGKESKKTLSSKDKDNNFSLSLDLKDFNAKRGEYQVEAYGVKADNKQVLLTKSAVVFPHHVPILMYHAVDHFNGQGLKDLFVSPDNFEAQMKYLKDNGYTLLTFERWGDIYKVNKPIFVTFDDGMKNNMNAFRILQKLKDDRFHPTATEYMIANCIDGGDSWLSTNDLKEMVNSGIFSVQSHTVSHADLPKITNYEAELKGSKEKIESVTGQKVIAIAYPFGHVNDKVVEETKKYYQYATTTKAGQFIEKGQPNELLLMQRVRIHNSTTVEQFASLVQEK
ncbi:polysaccharide deacetylase family protein [Microbacteriaceae bacterium 4G12]